MDVPSIARLAFVTDQSERLAVESTWKELAPVMCGGKTEKTQDHQSRVVSSDQLNKNNENNTRQK